MELRELKYFLAVAREESISKAAETLFITQPNLSRQMQNLETEIGQQLFHRGSRKITLTEAGQILRKRAEEILDLCAKTESELNAPLSDIGGDIYIGGGESHALGTIAAAAREMQTRHPAVKFHLFSGDSFTVSEKLDKGLLDFAVFIQPFDLDKYEHLRLPLSDTWGVMMRKDSPLATKETIAPEDLWNQPLIRSQQSLGKKFLSDWFGKPDAELNIVATYNLLYNASLLVNAGMGYAIGLDRLVNTTGDSNLCFRPFRPKLISHLDIAWKKYRLLPKCAELFLEHIQTELPFAKEK